MREYKRLRDFGLSRFAALKVAISHRGRQPDIERKLGFTRPIKDGPVEYVDPKRDWY